jgi:P27 family predicted phage terminase small subunit
LRAGQKKLPVEAPACPAFLSGEAKAEWRRAVRILKDMGLLTRADRSLLTTYCLTWADYVSLTEEIGNAGTAKAIVTGLMKARDRVAALLVRSLKEFGFSPAAREKLNIDPPGPRIAGERPKSVSEFARKRTG